MMKLDEFGRSMIEMLGVLALVGVLSVGGVAGFSKAMSNYKDNKLLSEYIEFVSEVMNYKEYLFSEHKKNSPSTYASNGLYKVSGFLDKALILPQGWEGEEGAGTGINDSSGDLIYVYVRKSTVQFDFFVKKSESSVYNINVCKLLLVKILREFSGQIEWLALYSNSQKVSDYLYGDQYCDGDNQKCYKDISFGDLTSMCSIVVDDNANLAVTVKMF